MLKNFEQEILAEDDSTSVSSCGSDEVLSAKQQTQEVDVCALSEALMPSIVVHDARRDIGLSVGCSQEIRFVAKTDSQVTLTQLWIEVVTARSSPFANRFNHAHDMCHGTSVYPASVRVVFEPWKADGLTKVLSSVALKNFVPDLVLAYCSCAE